MVDGRVRVVALDPPVRRGFLSRWKLGRAMARRLAELKPDLIFLPGNFHALLVGGLRRGTDVPIALKISNPPVPDAPFARVIFRLITRGVTGFAAMNSGLACELAAFLPGRQIITLHDPVYIGAAAVHARPPGRNILWIGRMEPQKDAALALEVMRVFDGHLTMLGDGALMADVRDKAAALKDKVTLAGYVPRIEPYLADADALLITSRYEGGGGAGARGAGGQHRLFLLAARSHHYAGSGPHRAIARSGHAGGSAGRYLQGAARAGKAACPGRAIRTTRPGPRLSGLV
jgi:glycosyltransferase involved in cell wall biosynthesis